MPRNIPQVGAPDPTLKTSPIFDEDEDELSLDQGLESGVCYFNEAIFALGDYVMSGNELLLCGERGVWERVGEINP
ncbi:MAG: hypothetical protein ACXWG1_10975 [Usitatibacter sp.]